MLSFTRLDKTSKKTRQKDEKETQKQETAQAIMKKKQITIMEMKVILKATSRRRHILKIYRDIKNMVEKKGTK